MLRRLAGAALDVLGGLERAAAEWRTRRRWQQLRAMGMKIGKGVHLPVSTWIDSSHCYLISIGDNCRFGPYCLILAHDALMDQYLDAGRLGRVVIGPGCQIGARCVILCNVEIGAGSVVEAGSVVAASLPAGAYCAGSPARVVCSIEEYAARLEKETRGRPVLSSEELSRRVRDPKARESLLAELAQGPTLVRGDSDSG